MEELLQMIHNDSLPNILSAKKSNVLILFYFSLMNADNFKRLAADKEMLLMLMRLYVESNFM